jgi:hypothetical protein
VSVHASASNATAGPTVNLMATNATTISRPTTHALLVQERATSTGTHNSDAECGTDRPASLLGGADVEQPCCRADPDAGGTRAGDALPSAPVAQLAARSPACEVDRPILTATKKG